MARLAKIISAENLGKQPVQVNKSVAIGGFGGRKDVPSVSFNVKRATEIQVIESIPTRIQLGSLPKREPARISIVSPSGKAIPLGSVNTNRQGKLELPPITVLKDPATARVVIRIDGKRFSFTLRATN